ncbi:MAG: hypothetical protein P8P56_09840 [Yoonia sp.]|nr:hypothetical protein [Yoonia sp.]MDG1862819.1 hypothetical protein [Yoonia sp.]
MRSALPVFCFLAACSSQDNQLGNPFTAPFAGFATAASNAVYSDRRGAVELFVKTNHPTLIQQINAGGGPTLTEAMNKANIPLEDRPARIVQLQSDLGLYDATPGALITALMVYGG